MTKQNVMMPEEMAITAATAGGKAGNSSTHFSFPPPRGNSGSVHYASCKRLLNQLDLNCGSGRINAWVDSMRSSSPTHIKSDSPFASPVVASDDEEYENWMVSVFYLPLAGVFG